MRSFLLLLFCTACISHLSARPMGEETTGKVLKIEKFGYSLNPPKGMITWTAGENEPKNYYFPWLGNKSGVINFAHVSNVDVDLGLTEAFKTHLKTVKTPYTGMHKLLKFENGILAIRAEFSSPDRHKGTQIVRYYLKKKGEKLKYVHILGYGNKGTQSLEDIVTSSLTPLTS